MAPDHAQLSQLQLTGILAVVCNIVHANLHRECVGSVSITEFAFTTTAPKILELPRCVTAIDVLHVYSALY